MESRPRSYNNVRADIIPIARAVIDNRMLEMFRTVFTNSPQSAAVVFGKMVESLVDMRFNAPSDVLMLVPYCSVDDSAQVATFTIQFGFKANGDRFLLNEVAIPSGASERIFTGFIHYETFRTSKLNGSVFLRYLAVHFAAIATRHFHQFRLAVMTETPFVYTSRLEKLDRVLGDIVTTGDLRVLADINQATQADYLAWRVTACFDAVRTGHDGIVVSIQFDFAAAVSGIHKLRASYTRTLSASSALSGHREAEVSSATISSPSIVFKEVTMSKEGTTEEQIRSLRVAVKECVVALLEIFR